MLTACSAEPESTTESTTSSGGEAVQPALSDEEFEAIRNRATDSIRLADRNTLQTHAMTDAQMNILFEDLTSDPAQYGYSRVAMLIASRNVLEAAVARMLELMPLDGENADVRGFAVYYFRELAKARHAVREDVPQACDVMAALNALVADDAATVLNATVGELATKALEFYTPKYTDCPA